MESSGGNPWPMAWAFTGLAVLTLVGGGLFVANAAKGEPVPAPKSFAKFQSKDNTFSCEYPTGWTQSSLESAAVLSEAEFRKGRARIEVSSDLAGSLMGDVGRSGESMLAGLPDMPGAPGLTAAVKKQMKPAVEVLHELDRKTYEKLYAGKKYQEGPMQKFPSQAGDARYSAFSYDGGFLIGKLQGYRATLLGSDRRITVFCRCSERDFKALDKAFKRVIGSVHAGAG